MKRITGYGRGAASIELAPVPTEYNGVPTNLNNYDLGQLIKDTSTGNWYIDNGDNTLSLVSSSSGDIVQLTGDSGTALPSGGSVQITGGTTGLTTTGSSAPGKITLTGTLNVSHGGTGIATTTAYAPIVGGTTATGAFQAATTGFATAGFVLTSNGNAALPSWQDSSVLVATITAVSSSPYVVLSTDYFLSVDTGVARTIQLPNAPSTGRMFVVKDASGTAAANNITVTTVGGVVLIDGAASYAINQNYGAIQLIFNGTAYEVF